jgi:K+-sensing histidine kinase KdpD
METDEYFIKFVLKIKDEGCGIPEEDQDKLFINFNKVSANSGKNKHGVGLGLSICKSLIE